MAIGPLSAATLTNPSSSVVLGISDANRVAITSGSTSRALNISATTVVKAGAGRIDNVAVTVAGSGAGSIHDCLTTAQISAANTVAVIPAVVGVISVDFPILAGLTVVPGTGQTVAVSFV
jgi:hypothetical protein